jgi:hypothetical protein
MSLTAEAAKALFGRYALALKLGLGCAIVVGVGVWAYRWHSDALATALQAQKGRFEEAARIASEAARSREAEALKQLATIQGRYDDAIRKNQALDAARAVAVDGVRDDVAALRRAAAQNAADGAAIGGACAAERRIVGECAALLGEGSSLVAGLESRARSLGEQARGLIDYGRQCEALTAPAPQ